MIPSLPWAWAVALRPKAWAVSTMAFISSSNIWRPRPPATLDSTPPVAANLITWAPCDTWMRTARRQSSGPSQVLTACSRSNCA